MLKVTRRGGDSDHKQKIGEMKEGTVFINSAENLCMKMKGTIQDEQQLPTKVKVCQLESAQYYEVDRNCRYEVVNAEIIWSKQGCPEGC